MRILQHLADSITLIKEYKNGYPELFWLIQSHIERSLELLEADSKHLQALQKINFRDADQLLKTVLGVYRELALEQIQKEHKVSKDSCSTEMDSKKFEVLLEKVREVEGAETVELIDNDSQEQELTFEQL